ncbi:MAG: hypothetical protein JWL71_127 [Acidobacteria bacterium]|nr:hypothetical protein [Acidobacteriota bacterium]
MDHPLPGLKYVDANDLDDSGMKFAGIEVDGVDGEKLGEVEGFVMDVVEGRPRHIAVGAGWFMHKHFLLPIGHATLDAGGTKLVADLTKERVKRFPGFDKSEFERLDAGQLAQLDATLAAACATDTGGGSSVDDHYQVPGWWKTSSGR